MARLSMERFMQLQEKGREPISLPAEIFFGGNEALQKTPGQHHLPQFRKTGTYNHPHLKAMRKRVALDRAKRLVEGKMPEVELRKIGGINGLQKSLEEFGLKIDEEQWEVALMNAHGLEAEGNAKLQMREEQRRLEMAKIGMNYEPGSASETVDKEEMTAKKLVSATVRAQKTKLSSDEDLSGLTDDSDKDKNSLSRDENIALARETGVIETDDDVSLKVIESI